MSANLSALASAAESYVQTTVAVVSDVGQNTVDAVTSLDEVQPLEHPIDAVVQVGGALLGVVGAGAELTNAGVAALTSPLAAMLPTFPAAHLGSLYVGIPHGHIHPPSLTPPSPVPVPLPSMGPVMLGTCVQVLIAGLPAARAGDLGMAALCGGFAPYFTVAFGSSKVFIGGTRAARQLDMCTACTVSTAGVVRGLAKALQVAGQTVALAGIAQQLVAAGQAAAASDEAAQAGAEADAQEQAALMGANAMGAAMSAAQMAADSAATAMSAMMGMDPGVPPGMLGFVTNGAANVQIGGMPLPNIPDPAQWLLKKLGAKAAAKWKDRNGKRVGGGGGCGR